MNPGKYWEIARVSFLESFAYRMDAFISLISSGLSLLMYFFIWKAITSTGSVSASLASIMTYYIIARTVQNTVFHDVERFVGPKIKRGTIVNELKRPVSFISHTYFDQLGNECFNLLTRSIPVLVVGSFFVDLSIDPLSATLFVISLFLSFNLVFLFSYSASMLIFWTKIEWAIRGSRTHIQKLFSGAIFPLFLLPEPLKSVFYLLPFQAMIDGPVRIFQGTSTADTLSILANQLLWIGIFSILAFFMWRKARKKLTVQGG